jgi:ubiquinone/menaquinone biosynthesis C-methylase UbiE
MSEMTWEEIIITIRKDPAFKDLVEKAYFEEDLELNVTRFLSSEEFKETNELLRAYLGRDTGLTIADVGAGNGVAAAAFAKNGNVVHAVEPDPSETIGAGAIRKLKKSLELDSLYVIDSFGEQIPLEKGSCDLVYIRQAMHHASDLKQFVAEAARLLKKGGILLTVRDHVIYNPKDKAWFLKVHPLHKFYGGENAFTFEEYSGAMTDAGLKVEKNLRHYDSVINYFPETRSDLNGKLEKRETEITEGISRKLFKGAAGFRPLRKWYSRRLETSMGPVLDERKIAGRLITFIARKP